MNTISWADDKALFRLFREKLYTAVVGDIMDQMGLFHQFLPPRIRPLEKGMVIVGRAMTVQEKDREVPNAEGTKTPAFGLMLEALDDLKEDEVYICAGASPSYALVGELMATRAKRLHAAGFVADGYVRDTEGILRLGLPCFSCGSYAQDQAPRGAVTAWRVPIQVGGVTVRPGDIVFGDGDGVLAIPQEREREIVRLAYEKATGEQEVFAAIKNGMSAAAAFAEYGIM